MSDTDLAKFDSFFNALDEEKKGNSNEVILNKLADVFAELTAQISSVKKSNLNKWGRRVAGATGFLIGAAVGYTYFDLGRSAALLVCNTFRLTHDCECLRCICNPAMKLKNSQ